MVFFVGDWLPVGEFIFSPFFFLFGATFLLLCSHEDLVGCFGTRRFMIGVGLFDQMCPLLHLGRSSLGMLVFSFSPLPV